jgi:hypothetical protein
VTIPSLTACVDAQSLEREAAAILADALALAPTLHLPGVREHHRQKLERAIELSSMALAAAANGGTEPRTLVNARLTLVKAHATRAEDARHGAGQLSQGSQRAPTREDCDDGWRRVEAIVSTCKTCALEARRIATELDDHRAWKAAQAADAAARDAQRIVSERNHAYTFHADPGFSFGEGWYLAAASILAGVAIQIEPGQPQTSQAERFLQDAGLGPLLVPYRSRPRANKALPDIIARAFRADPLAAQAKLRTAFLGNSPIPEAIVDWTDRTLTGASKGKKVLLWVRYGAHHPMRNTTHCELVEVCRLVRVAELVPVLIGDALKDGKVPPGAVDMTLFWKQPIFQGADMRRAQLKLFEHMRQAHGLVGQLGVTTAGMDGPALVGLPTMYLTEAPNVRLGRWVGVVPGYEEVVRDSGHLERIGQTLKRWVDNVQTSVGPTTPQQYADGNQPSSVSAPR